jgi:small subunit ribosomal protein S6
MAELSNKYELMIVLKPLLPDDVRKALHKGIHELVEELGGKVDDTDVWGKRYLAYKILGHNEGYYILYQMTFPSSSVTELRRQLELKQEVLRYMVVKIERPEELEGSLKKKEMELESDDEGEEA